LTIAGVPAISPFAPRSHELPKHGFIFFFLWVILMGGGFFPHGKSRQGFGLV